MSGDRILSFDNMEITGWYHDGYKWNTAANDGQGDFEQIDRWTAETADEYVPVENDSHAVSLKAAHPLMYTLTYMLPATCRKAIPLRQSRRWSTAAAIPSQTFRPACPARRTA